MKNIYHIATISDLITIIDITGMKYILDENYIEIEKDGKVYLCPINSQITFNGYGEDFNDLFPLVYTNGKLFVDKSLKLGHVGPARITNMKNSFTTGFAALETWNQTTHRIKAIIKTYPTGRVGDENGHRLVYTRITV